MNEDEIRRLLQKSEFPRSNRYDPAWLLDGNMGPNPLWLLEWLTEALMIEPGMRVLDLGCGKALTSVFLAREFDARVFAVDWWTDVDDNWRRIRDAGESSRVVPIHVEAHALPFAEDFFDAVISIDAYQYFGTDELYLHYLTRFVRPSGRIGLVMPGLARPFSDGELPRHLSQPQSNGKVFWEDECASFHTAEWWKRLCGQCNRIAVDVADMLPEGWRHWRDSEIALERSGKGLFPSDAEALDADSGRYIGFVRVVATRNEARGYNLYDPALVASVEREQR
ncbi:MAG: methyltransferase domain-containing protein [Vicinamibacteria bacterium]|nr:methyltransferase domain-containing protein [Vicinamibacteria bacterium]